MLGNCIIGFDINRGIDKPKNLSFNNIKCDKNNRPFDNSTNGNSYGLSCDTSYYLFLDSPCDIIIQTWNRHGVIRWFIKWLDNWTDAWFVKWNNEWFNKRFYEWFNERLDGRFDEWFNDWTRDVINII